MNKSTKCPRCGIRHNKVDLALRCQCQIDNQWAHFVILCYNMPGGATRENLACYKHIDLEYFEETKKLKCLMEEYLAKEFNIYYDKS